MFIFEKGRYCYFPKHHQYLKFELLLTVLWRTVSSAKWHLVLWWTPLSVAEQHTLSVSRIKQYYSPLICVLPIAGTVKFHTYVIRIATNKFTFWSKSKPDIKNYLQVSEKKFSIILYWYFPTLPVYRGTAGHSRTVLYLQLQYILCHCSTNIYTDS